MGIAQRIAARVPRELWLRPVADIWETEHRLLHALGRARPPAAVQWMVTRSCDLHCGHCYAQAGHKAQGELSTSEAKRLVIDATADMGCPLLVLAGGELWLRRDIEELIEHTVARGLEWAMHTHGGHVAKHQALLRRHPPVLAAISLDGDRELHDGFRGKTGSHAAALAAARVLVEAGCREVVLGTTVTRHNADHIADMFSTVVRSGAHSWGLHLVAPEGRAALELVPRPEQLRRIAAFARSRRAQFPVELCNEWGSAGADDAYYRDRPFLCGAGRISLVVDPTGEVMPCTTTDVRESEGNVRDAPLDRLWREGFARFRQGGDPTCSDTSECWLQTRNGVRIAEAAFGSVARPRPKLVDFVPTKLIDLSHRTLAARGPDDRFASTLTRKAITATAVGLAVLGACTLSREPSEPSTTGGRVDEQPPSEVTHETAGATQSTTATPTEWPSSLDLSGQHAYAAWAQMDGPWKSSTLPQLLAWERGGPAPRITVPRSDPGVDQVLLASFEQELARHVGRGFGQGNAMDLLGLLEAAEHAALFDAAFAAHLWRASELIVAADVEPRAKLHDRLARHHHVVLALVATTATLGPISQRPWLKKSAPPAGWREQQLPEGFERTARGLLSAGVSGPWDSVGISVRFEGSKPPIVHRGGGSSTASLRKRLRWGRLDVLEFVADTRVLLPSAIEIDVPAGAALTHASLARSMSSSTRARLDALIDQALAGDRPSLAEIEVLLPVACAQLRARLADSPDAAGAPALRTMLVGYEE
jgi:MoaA/NifB/PqqE/SkfB family radical SAM enzyme